MEQVVHINGLNLHLVPSKKYKTITIVAKLRGQLNRDSVTKRALLPFVLRQGTKTYPTREKLQHKLDDLYGASLSLDAGKAGLDHVISVRMEVANQKYIENESSILKESLELLHEVIFNPLADEHGFDETIVDRELQSLKQQLRSIKDDKVNYAQQRLIDEMCAGETFQIHAQGYEADLEDITRKNLMEAYQTILEEDVMDLYVLGDFDHETVKKMIETTITKSNATTKKADVRAKLTRKQDGEPQEVIEREDIQQAKLHIGYRTGIVYKDADYPALLIYNGILGGFPGSKLFLNVREKHGLAYYVASGVENYTGLLYVYSGVAAEDYEKATQIIKEQFDDMRTGEFTDADIAETKAMIVNQVLESMDSAQGLIELLYQNVLGGRETSLETLIEDIQRVEKEDITQIANNVTEDTIYLLTREEA